MSTFKNQKHDVPFHTKVWSLKRHSCFGCSRTPHSKASRFFKSWWSSRMQLSAFLRSVVLTFVTLEILDDSIAREIFYGFLCTENFIVKNSLVSEFLVSWEVWFVSFLDARKSLIGDFLHRELQLSAILLLKNKFLMPSRMRPQAFLRYSRELNRLIKNLGLSL